MDRSTQKIEENANPSIFALRAYDATWAIAQAIKVSQRRETPKTLREKILSNSFEGLSGKISFKNSKLC
jgi:ABC-type branched-subunit amino acid transport system substrate-binding protein